MKNLFIKSFYAVLMLSMVYAVGMTTGSEAFALGAMGTVGLTSALTHSGVFKSMAFNAPVVPDFTAKSPAEIQELKPDELEKYLKERKEYENAVWEKKQYDAIEALKTELKDSTKEELDKLVKAKEEEFKAIKDQLDDHFLMLKAAMEKGGKKGEDVEKTVLKKWFDSKEREEALKKGQGINQVTLKAAELMSIAAVGAGSAHITTANGYSINVNNFVDPKIYSTPKDRNFILGLVSVQNQPGTEKIWWSERNNEEGDAEFLAEGGLKPLIDANWETKSADMTEVAERWKFTKRLMLHTNSVVNDFQTHARELIENKIDEGVLSGDGVAPNLSGITTEASAFVVPAALANYYDYVNIYDVMMAVMTQVEIANFMTTDIVLHTSWRAKMFGVKSETEAQYILHPLVTPDGRTFAGVRITFTNRISDEHILAGDLGKFNVVFGENIMFDEGYENDDFSKNLISRKLEAFLGTYLPAPDAAAIVYDEIATIEAAIANTAS